MRAAIRQAAKGMGRTSPNPAVGAVLVDRGRIVARGFHRGPGEPHAEVECLGKVSRRIAARSTLYVTLEPCSTVGRTGRCVDAIVAAKIPQVVIGTIDPNPRHNGRGLALLRKAGVEVIENVLPNECRGLNEGFNKWIVTKRPFVIAKCGMTLDGRLTRPAGESRWITSAAARRDANALRATVDAVLIGAETLRRDDPRLSVRGIRDARQPWRVVVTRSGKLPARSRILQDKRRTLIYRDRALNEVLIDLGAKEIMSVLIEGGGDVLGQALDAGLIDKVQIYVAPLISGGPVLAFPGEGAASTSDAVRLERVTYRKIGNDVCVTGSVAETK